MAFSTSSEFVRESALTHSLGLGEGQTSILDVPSVALRSRLASYAVTASSNGNPLPFVAPE